ncbi:MAG: hypothetical protein PVI97_20470 [Candidatus Thiodiazotropha sp.]|jgi:hypothetical protein
MKEGKGFFVRHRGKLISTIVLILFVAAYYLLLVRNPLPSDEEMIEHFRLHRNDIEELVRRYRNYSTDPKVDHSMWFKEGDTQKIMWRAGVEEIWHSAYSPWLPNPYSIETAESIMQQIRNVRGHGLFTKYGGLVLKLLPRDYYRSVNLKYLHIWKDFYNIPEAPRIEKGELLWPFDHNGEYSVRRRIISSLDQFPGNWKDYECVYRQIETHWFLRLCNGH